MGKMDPQSPFQLKEELAAKESTCGKRQAGVICAGLRQVPDSSLRLLSLLSPGLLLFPFHISSLDSVSIPWRVTTS